MVREEFPGTEKSAYLNSAATGLLCRGGIEAAKTFVDRMAEGAHVLFAHVLPILDRTRVKLAKILGVPPIHVGFTTTTSRAVDFAALMLLKDGRRHVVMKRDEFPASSAPFYGRGYEVEIVDDYKSAIRKDTVAIVASAVQFGTGERQELRELKEEGVYLVANITQAAGVVPLDLTDVDFAAGTGMKYLCGGTGSAFWVCRPELIEKFGPPWTGWNSHQDTSVYAPTDRPFRMDASVVEGGAYPFLPFVTMEPALDLILEFGVEAIGAHQRRLLKPLERLKILSPPNRGGSVLLEGPAEIAEKMQERGVIVAARAGGIRVAPHFYNNEEDIQRFLSLWDELA